MDRLGDRGRDEPCPGSATVLSESREYLRDHRQAPARGGSNLMHDASMNRLSPVIALIGILARIATTSAETYPSHPVTMIVPFAAGGPMDTVARVVADGKRTSLGQRQRRSGCSRRHGRHPQQRLPRSLGL
jgi:hypothetical protein